MDNHRVCDADAFNVTGNANTLTMTSGTITNTDASGKGINLIGNSNTVSITSSSVSAPGGKVWLGTPSTANSITDAAYAAPGIFIFNGTAGRGSKAWYFYNTSTSFNSKNENPAILISQVMPISGYITFRANLSNVTGA
jgi:hypothetical protein